MNTTAQSGLIENLWTHLVITVDTGNSSNPLKLYKNGIELSEKPTGTLTLKLYENGIGLS